MDESKPQPKIGKAKPASAPASADDRKIGFRCQRCGAKLKVPAKLAGKYVYCPKCKNQTPAPLSPAAADEDVGDYHVNKMAYEVPNACTTCGEKMKKGAVLCVNCGYDYRAGKQLEVVDRTHTLGEDVTDAPSPSEAADNSPSPEGSEERRTSPREATNPLNSLGIFVVFVLVVWAVASLASAVLLGDHGLVVIVFIGGGLAGALFCWWAASTQCSLCKSIWVKEYLGRDLVDRQEGYDTVTRHERDTEGRIKGSWEEQVHVVRLTHLEHYRCSACGHEWAALSQSERQG